MPDHYAGEVHFLPPEERPGGDDQDRRHVLLATCNSHSLLATFAFASTRPTEARLGAPNVLIDPHATSYNRTGFELPTYVYPSRIATADPDDLVDDYEGRIIDEMPLLRGRLSQALGRGTGTADGAGAAAGSWRGRVLRVVPALEAEIRTPLVLVVSDPAYSLAESYQNVVPILSAREYMQGGLDVEIEGAPWLASIDRKFKDAYLYTEGVFGLFHPEEIAATSRLCLTEATLTRLDEAFKIYFEL